MANLIVRSNKLLQKILRLALVADGRHHFRCGANTGLAHGFTQTGFDLVERFAARICAPRRKNLGKPSGAFPRMAIDIHGVALASID
ncbi:MAG: hypothetical protein EOQ68_19075 [Mesorhizobium sp.]|nr:MAG: hypothetical protein EOQ68_19075 [Mesorhizobium sp.]